MRGQQVEDSGLVPGAVRVEWLGLGAVAVEHLGDGGDVAGRHQSPARGAALAPHRILRLDVQLACVHRGPPPHLDDLGQGSLDRKSVV